MTVGQLIERLEDFDPATPIRLAMQPNYPMLGSIRNIAEWVKPFAGKNKTVCLIACSGHEDYGCPRDAWDTDLIDETDDGDDD